MIVIYSNSNPNIYGGVEVLISRFAKFLNERCIDFVVVEGEGSLLYQQINKANRITPDKIRSVADAAKYIFFPKITAVRLLQEDINCFGHANFLGWIVHPNDAFMGFMPYAGILTEALGYDGMVLLRNILGKNYELARTLFSQLTEKNGLIAMDGACIRSLKYFYPTLSQLPPIVPIPCQDVALQDGVAVSRKGLSVAYFGRLDAFKASALIPVIKNQIAELNRNRGVVLHIFGSGDCESKVNQACRLANVEVKFHGFLPNEIARQRIRDTTDLSIGMGTAALDMAMSGHPTIYIDPALSRFARPQKKFRFVHQTESFTLGEYRDFPNYVSGLSDFDECISGMEGQNVGRLGREYVLSHHSTEKIFESLVSLIKQSQSCFSDVLSLTHEINRKFAAVRNSTKWIR